MSGKNLVNSEKAEKEVASQVKGGLGAKRIFVFITSFIIWTVISWPFDVYHGQIYWQMFLFGLLVAFLTAWIFGRFAIDHPHKSLNPIRYFWGFLYIFVLIWYVLLANLDVVYRVLHPGLPIKPGIVRVKTRLSSQSARTALANSITLTPGTMTVDIKADGTMYIHWIKVAGRGEEAQRQIVGRFEGLLRRVLE